MRGCVLALLLAMVLAACGDIDQTSKPVDPSFADDFTAATTQKAEAH